MDYLILGIVQGLTEFLPVSSSGHLVVFEHLLHISKKGIGLEVLLHAATLFALLIYFRRDLRYYFTLRKSPYSELSFPVLIIVGTIPVALLGFLFKEKIESMFETIRYVPYFFLINGFIIFATKFRVTKRDKIGIIDAFLIGLFQAFALLPGISRSGATISMAIYLGIKGEKAFNFSFLLVIPAILGALLLELKDVALSLGPGELMGFLTAFLSGLLALYILRKLIILKRFHLFGIYTIILSIIILLT